MSASPQGSVAKGATALATLAYVSMAHGAEVCDALLATLAPSLRERLSRLDATTELPYADLLAVWRGADALLREREPLWVEHSGAHSIERAGAQLYRGILRKRSPHEFLTQSVSLFQLFYAPGNMQVVEDDETRAVLRLSGFDSQDTLFCRRQTGGLQQALQLAGGESPRVKHVRCVHADDAFCEWELTWTRDAREGRDGKEGREG
ncbi:MAG: hypothetical protein U0164_17470 [Gemmatimonadaceae bacterium]